MCKILVSEVNLIKCFFKSFSSLRFIFPSDRVKVIDLTPSTSILSVSLLHTESNVDLTASSEKRYRNVDSRFGNTTYNRLELDHEGGTVPLDATSEIYTLPAGSEVEVDVSGGVGMVPSDSTITSTAECVRWSVASSVMCVLHAVNKRDGGTVTSDSQLMKALDVIIKSQIRSPSSTGDVTVDATAAVSGVNTDVRGRVSVMLGRGSVGVAWWDTMR